MFKTSPSAPVRTARPLVLWLLLLVALGITRLATPPAHSQGWGGPPPHVHNWTVDIAPDHVFWLSHIGGLPITDQSPAYPCEILEVNYGSAVFDQDQCTNENCNFPDGIGYDPWGRPVQWADDDEIGEDAFGHFGSDHQGCFVNDEFYDEAAERFYGNGPVRYYRVARDQAVPSTVTIREKVDDTATVDDNGNPIPAFDDAERWSTTQYSFPVGNPPPGANCDIRIRRYVAEGDNSSCKGGSNQAGYSAITPLNGNVTFQVPITSWGYGGQQLDLALTYNSNSIVDASASFFQVKHPAALSDKDRHDTYNPKWTHSYAQWIEVVWNGYAVWNRGDGTQMAFEQYWVEQSGPFWRSVESYHQLASVGALQSPGFRYQDDETSVSVPYAEFTMVDGDQTVYEFKQVRWNISEHPPEETSYAIPYFLLTKVTDRWGRSVAINWDDKGVTSVDAGGGSLTFAYNADDLIESVTDPFGRTHTFTHTDYGGQPKLTGITVTGPGSPNATNYNWSFAYGTATNDLIVSKIEPSGKTATYEYEAVNPARTANGDWDGRLTRTTYTDDLMNPPVLREILRSGTTLTYPGGDSYTFTYSGDHLTQVTHDTTGATVYYAWDAYHNLTAFRTGQEAVGQPLVGLEYTYTNPDGRHIAGVTATDKLGNQATSVFNQWNLPTTVTALGVNNPSQTTAFEYDGGGALTVGNLTQLAVALGTPSQDFTSFVYGDSTRPDLPTRITNSAGGSTLVSYHEDGTPYVVQSPLNMVAPANDPDRARSLSTLDQTSDELPSLITDPQGHQHSVSYNAEAQGSPNLVVTFTSLADASTRTVTLDANGQVVRALDENGVETLVTYNRAGQPLSVRTAVGTPVEKTVWSYYDAYGNLSAFDPPGGAAGQVTYEYCRYDIWFPGFPPMKATPETYTGQVTRINYPDGTSEYFGYNGQEELNWHFSQDGFQTDFVRDSLHRVYRVDYPAKGAYPAFSVTVNHDEFGRVTDRTDYTGTTLYSYDDLNRPVMVAPPLGQTATYGYQVDGALNRYTSTVTLSGVGTWEHRGDSKGRTAEVLNPFSQLTAFEYDLDGKLLKETRANGTTTEYAYTPRDWLGGIQHKLANGAVLDQFDYFYTDGGGAYDPTGRLHREVDVLGQTHEFFYNAQGEVTSETHPDFGAQSYSYDANGNRVFSTATGYYGVDAQNKLLWVNSAGNFAPTTGQGSPYRIYTYDLAGNPTQIERRDAGGPVVHETYFWDGAGKLRRVFCVGGGVDLYTAQYDGAGNRVSSNLNGTAHTYSYGAGLLYDSDGGTVYTPGISQRKNGADSYFHADWIGSTRYLTDSTGLAAPTAYRFDAFGTVTNSAGPDSTSSKYAGQWGYQSDAVAGLQLLGARYYDPAAGRFLSPDPIGFAGGLNLYGYVGNDPVGGVDPSGLNPNDISEFADDPELYQAMWMMTRGSLAGAFHREEAAGVNAYYRRAGWGTLFPGDRPLGADALAIYQTFGMVGVGGPAVGAVGSVGRAASAMSCSAKANKPGVFRRIGNWFKGVFGRGSKKPTQVTNPYGRRGSPAHRAAIEAVQTRLENKGWARVSGGTGRERAVHLANGSIRYPDLVMKSNGRTIAIQVGRRNGNGAPIARERTALQDLRGSGRFNHVWFFGY